MKIVADHKIPFLRGVFEPCAEVVYLPGGQISARDVRDADAVVTRTRTACNASLLEGSTVKMIASATIGFDHLDVPYLESRGIKWCNAPGCNASSVAQYIASVLVNLAARHQLRLREMALGVVGVGNVGSKVAQVGAALGMRALLNDPPRAEREGGDGFVGLRQLTSEADVVTLHVPLARDGRHPTFHLADSAFFAAMKNSAFLINSSRGAVSDNQALKEALRGRRIKGAALDVWEGEPNPDQELLELVEFGTPHIAGYSLDGKANGTAMSVNAVAAAFNLPLRNWYPADIPLPPQTRLTLDAREPAERQLLQAINFAYDVNLDSERLRNSPETFEEQRGNYPLRREFPLFSVATDDPEANAVLASLGFQC